MGIANDNGWDFVKKGGVYQYKEDWLILIVEVLEDDSDDTMYSFLMKPIAGTQDMREPFRVTHSKKLKGVFSGMINIYEDAEYYPAGGKWKYIFDNETLEKTEYRYMF